MMYVYEFEFFEDDGWVLAFPLDLNYQAGTQGKDMSEAVYVAADLLNAIAERHILHDLPLPDPVYGHKPKHSGEIKVIGVNVSPDTIEALRASEAADRLGVSRGRVSNLVMK